MHINISRFKDLWPCFYEARYAWIALGAIIIAFAISLRPHTSEHVIRLTGLALQLLGIGTVIWGISETRAFFGHPSFVSKIKLWLKRFPIMHRHKNIELKATSLSVSATGKPRLYIKDGPIPNATIEDRIGSLERNITLIHQRVDCTEKEMDNEFHKVKESLTHEEQTRQSEDNILHKKLETTGTGGVHISAIGASWLFVGVVLSTAAVEIAKLLK
jgi:hypothetical protein